LTDAEADYPSPWSSGLVSLIHCHVCNALFELPKSCPVCGHKRTGDLATCEQWMLIPPARPVKVVLVPSGEIVVGALETGEKTIAATVPAAQLGDAAKLYLSATFGENRTVGLKFDKFGRRTEFVWSAEATAANATSALTGVAADASKIVTTLEGRSLAADKLELNRLTTEQNLRKARACQALLDAGATSCD
jgi:hypothetical protein